MDNFARSRCRLLRLGLAAAVGCGGGTVGPVGISPPRAVESAGHDVATDAGALTLPGDFRTRLSRVSDRFLSQGHADRFDAILWANDSARGVDAGSDAAEGAIFVEEAVDRGARDGGAAGLLVMEKRGGTWRFAAIEPDGKVVGDTRAAACAACHRDAPHDFVFRTPPRP